MQGFRAANFHRVTISSQSEEQAFIEACKLEENWLILDQFLSKPNQISKHDDEKPGRLVPCIGDMGLVCQVHHGQFEPVYSIQLSK